VDGLSTHIDKQGSISFNKDGLMCVPLFDNKRPSKVHTSLVKRRGQGSSCRWKHAHLMLKWLYICSLTCCTGSADVLEQILQAGDVV